MELTMTTRTYRHLIKKHSKDIRSTSGLLKYVCRELRAFMSLYIRPKCLCTCKMNMFLKQKLPTRILDISGSVFCNFNKSWISEIHNSRRSYEGHLWSSPQLSELTGTLSRSIVKMLEELRGCKVRVW